MKSVSVSFRSGQFAKLGQTKALRCSLIPVSSSFPATLLPQCGPTISHSISKRNFSKIQIRGRRKIRQALKQGKLRSQPDGTFASSKMSRTNKQKPSPVAVDYDENEVFLKDDGQGLMDAEDAIESGDEWSESERVIHVRIREDAKNTDDHSDENEMEQSHMTTLIEEREVSYSDVYRSDSNQYSKSGSSSELDSENESLDCYDDNEGSDEMMLEHSDDMLLLQSMGMADLSNVDESMVDDLIDDDFDQNDNNNNNAHSKYGDDYSDILDVLKSMGVSINEDMNNNNNNNDNFNGQLMKKQRNLKKTQFMDELFTDELDDLYEYPKMQDYGPSYHISWPVKEIVQFLQRLGADQLKVYDLTLNEIDDRGEEMRPQWDNGLGMVEDKDFIIIGSAFNNAHLECLVSRMVRRAVDLRVPRDSYYQSPMSSEFGSKGGAYHWSMVDLADTLVILCTHKYRCNLVNNDESDIYELETKMYPFLFGSYLTHRKELRKVWIEEIERLRLKRTLGRLSKALTALPNQSAQIEAGSAYYSDSEVPV